MKPTIGRIVTYRSRTGRYDLPAIVTATVDTLWPDGVELGQVPALDSDAHVHLHVFTPGSAQGYQEFNVPFDAVRDADVPPGTWRWPARS